MADTKITQLQPPQVGYPVVPATDVLPIVVIADPGMATSGSTRKVTVNQLLGAGGTATLASATITGDLTVDTSVFKVNTTTDQVGIGTATPTASTRLDVVGGTFARFNKGAANQYHLRIGNSSKDYGLYVDIDNNGTNGFSLYDITASADVLRYVPGASGSWTHYINGTTAMTLNSTGLGVGVVGVNGIKLSSFVTTDGAPATSGTTQTSGSLRIGAASTTGSMDMGTAGSYSWIQALDRTNLATNYDLVLQKNGGNVGIGVTPSAWASIYKAIELPNGSSIWGQTDVPQLSLQTNAFLNSSFQWIYKTTAAASNYRQTAGQHLWFTAPSGTAGNAITFTQAMTLDASGNLILLSSNTPATLTTNGQLTVNATSNTNLRFSYRGSDGTTRVANITLA